MSSATLCASTKGVLRALRIVFHVYSSVALFFHVSNTAQYKVVELGAGISVLMRLMSVKSNPSPMATSAHLPTAYKLRSTGMTALKVCGYVSM